MIGQPFGNVSSVAYVVLVDFWGIEYVNTIQNMGILTHTLLSKLKKPLQVAFFAPLLGLEPRTY